MRLAEDHDQFFRTLFPVLLRWVGRAMGSKNSDVEDVVQDVVLTAWAKRDQYRGQSSAMTWVITIARRKLIDRIRSYRLRAPYPSVSSPDKSAGVLSTLESRENCSIILRAVRNLPSEDAECLRHRSMQEKCRGKPARRKESTRQAAYYRLCRARQSLLESLAMGTGTGD